MAQERYYGEYAKFEAIKSNGADFMGADNLVGDAYTIDIRDEDSRYKGYMINRFGATVAYLEDRVIRRLQLAQAKGWETRAYLSFVAFTQGTSEENPGRYWGEVALVAYDPRLESVMQPFFKKLSAQMANGARPQVDFGEKSVDRLIESKGEWFPTDTAKRAAMGKETEIIKDHQTPNERLVEQTRKGNIGCYIAAMVFNIAVIALIIYTLHLIGIF